MVQSSVLGYPRIGRNRELKKITEAFWKGEIKEVDLHKKAKEIRLLNWNTQKNAGINIIPSNDFSFYDQMLDMSVLLGAIPPRFAIDGPIDLHKYFLMARGLQSVPAMEMTKWFDTNYHYIVPEFCKNQKFKISSDKPFSEYEEAKSAGIKTRPVLIGPITYLMLGKLKESEFPRFSLLESLLCVYKEILSKFKHLGIEWVQIDEPVLVMNLNSEAKQAFIDSYKCLSKEVPGLKIMLTTYYGSLSENMPLVSQIPISGLHVDFVRDPSQLNSVISSLSKDIVLSAGVVDGRNIWKSELGNALETLETITKTRGKENLIVSSSCSLLHVPLDLDLETNMDPELRSWLSFAQQKLVEMVTLQKAIEHGRQYVLKELDENERIFKTRKESRKVFIQSVRDRLNNVSSSDYSRKNPFKIRQKLQREKLKLPSFPTTTIGSFPQTPDVRAARAKFKSGEFGKEQYEKLMKEKIKDAINRQNQIGLDVLVHGEPERNDMVEYFGEMLDGFAFTKHGWVQSYGSRYVKPPVIYGDVKRSKPMTVDWIKYAQSLTEKPVKGMLTGPITILQWSFVRNDQPRSTTAKQIALALRDEVQDLEAAGIKIIQIDEPAIREGLPIQKSEWEEYLKWAVESFRLTSSGVKDETQIHTHMCYSEFNDMIEAIAEMDADVISIEASRSQMELLDAFKAFKYPNEIGPGVYDVHSPSVPTEKDMENLLKKALKVLPKENIWVNPDCGLKTRGWEETTSALKNMIGAAKAMRECKVHA
jgi:5-methyltetrahydropteroyltriglutamate--homocysteine methyltransferase